MGLSFTSGISIAGTSAAALPVSQVVASSATPVRVAGNAGAEQTVASFTLPANTITPSSVLTLKGLVNLPIANLGGTIFRFKIGGVTIATATFVANVGALQFIYPMYIGPAGNTIDSLSGGINAQTVNTDATAGVAWTTLAARGTFGPFPYAAQATIKSTITTVDFSVDNTIVMTMTPTTGSINELTSWSLVNDRTGTSPESYASSLAVPGWGDSLTAGTGSGNSAGIIFSTNGTTDGSTAVVTSITTTSVQPNMLVTGTGIPAGTVVVSKTGSTVTLNKNTTTGATSSLTFTAGAWPAQVGFQSPGRPYFNGGVGGDTAAQIQARFLRDTVRGKLWSPVIWAGRNNVGTATFQTDVVTAVGAMVANLAPGTVPIVCSVTTSRQETTGTSNNTAVLATNAALSSIYGTGYLDLFSLICTNNGAPADEFLAYTAGAIPANEVHLNDYGYSLVAAAVLAKRIALGI